MNNVLKTVVDNVFSFNALMITCGLLFAFSFYSLITGSIEAKELTKAVTMACYDNGMVMVNTDAGFYCVAPANLVKVAEQAPVE